MRAWDREVLGLGLRVSSLPSRFCCPARWGDDFEDWEKKPAVPEKKVLLQKLDDFDGLAPPPEPKKDEEPGASVCVCVCVCVCMSGVQPDRRMPARLSLPVPASLLTSSDDFIVENTT